jgi:hypothetical protein
VLYPQIYEATEQGNKRKQIKKPKKKQKQKQKQKQKTKEALYISNFSSQLK